MKTLGLDISSTSTGWAVLSDRLVLDACGVIDFNTKTPHKERMFILAETLATLLLEHKPDWVVIEDTFLKANVKVTKLLNKYSGVAIHTVYTKLGKDIPIAMLTPAAIRAAIFPKQKITKEYIDSHMKQKYNLDPALPNDISDAIAAACYPHLKTVEKKDIM